MNKILLINPPQRDTKVLRDEICFQPVNYIPFPLRLGQIAAVLTKMSIDIEVIDANAWGFSLDDLSSKIKEINPNYILIQSAPGIIKEDIEVLKIAKSIDKNMITIFLESVISPIYTQRIMEEFPCIDIVIRGQHENVIKEIIEKFSNTPKDTLGIAYRDDNEIKINPPLSTQIDLDALPFMPYHMFPMDLYTIEYLEAPMLQKEVKGIRFRSTRDCPFLCAFCIIGSSPERGYDAKMKLMSPKRLVDEMELLYKEYNIEGMTFWDETFTINRKRTIEICDEIIKRKIDIKWRCLTRFDCLNQEMLNKMAQAGCMMIELGMESGNQEIRKHLNKKFPDSTIVNGIEMCKKAGILTNVDVIIGMPWETKNSIKETVELAKTIKADHVHISVGFPYPKTKFYEIAEENNLLEFDDAYDLIVNERVRVGAKPYVKTLEMTSDELYSEYQIARNEINKYNFKNNILKKPSNLWKHIKATGSISEIINRGFRVVKKYFI